MVLVIAEDTAAEDKNIKGILAFFQYDDSIHGQANAGTRVAVVSRAGASNLPSNNWHWLD